MFGTQVVYANGITIKNEKIKATIKNYDPLLSKCKEIVACSKGQ